MEQESRAAGMKISQDQFLRKGDYADAAQIRSLYDQHKLVLCHTIDSNSWIKVEKLERNLSYTGPSPQKASLIFTKIYFNYT